jgi:predicted transcriptional regulator
MDGSFLILHNGEVIGIFTGLISHGRNPSKIRIRETISTPILAVGPKPINQKALSLMDKHVVRQLIVSSDGAALGIVSKDDISEKIQMASISTADTALRRTPVCIINLKLLSI